MDRSKNVRWIIPFKKFGMVRVNISRLKGPESTLVLVKIQKKMLLDFCKERSKC